MGMRLIGDQVKKVAKLANLPLSEEEIVKSSRVSLSQDEALKNASQKKNGFFITKGVFEE